MQKASPCICYFFLRSPQLIQNAAVRVLAGDWKRKRSQLSYAEFTSLAANKIQNILKPLLTFNISGEANRILSSQQTTGQSLYHLNRVSVHLRFPESLKETFSYQHPFYGSSSVSRYQRATPSLLLRLATSWKSFSLRKLIVHNCIPSLSLAPTTPIQ